MYARVRAEWRRDPIGAHRLWRDGRNQLFQHHPQSPIAAADRERFTMLRYFDYDPCFAFTAKIHPLPELRCEIQTSHGATMPAVRFGAVDVPVGTLDIMWVDAYGGGLFLPFADATSGKTTYGGGRYLLDTAKHADLGMRGEELVLDFNFAYYPSCAYDTAWACPLPSAANRLADAIEAGERW